MDEDVFAAADVAAPDVSKAGEDWEVEGCSGVEEAAALPISSWAESVSMCPLSSSSPELLGKESCAGESLCWKRFLTVIR